MTADLNRIKKIYGSISKQRNAININIQLIRGAKLVRFHQKYYNMYKELYT